MYLDNLGIPQTNITTTSYQISKDMRSEQVNNTWVSVFKGYQVTNQIEVRLSNMANDMNLID